MKFCEDDFNGKDIKLSLDYQIEYDKENDNKTMLAVGNVEHPFEVTEKNNTAVYCLLYYLAGIKKKKGTLIMGGN